MTDHQTSKPDADAIYSMAEAEDVALAQRDTKPRSQAQLVAGRFFRHKAAMISLGFLGLVIVLAFTSVGFAGIPGWWPKSYLTAGAVIDGGVPTMRVIPSWLGGEGLRWGEHPFGQDSTGKDYFALVMHGTQRSLMIGLVVGSVATTIGAVLGAVAGYYRGWVDSVLMRITDVFIVIPLLLLAAVLGQIAGNIGQSVVVLGAMLGLVFWTGLARLVRGEVLTLREREFVAAAVSMGANGPRVIFRHLLPNAVGVIVVSATFTVAGAILVESSLSYLGFGVRPPESSLGLLIAQYQGSFDSRPWLFWWPNLLILGVTLAVNFLGDGLRDAFDPRQSGKHRKRQTLTSLFRPAATSEAR